jgi:hypothetical protein
MATQANTLTGTLTGTIGNVVFPTTVFTPVQTAQATQTKVAQATLKINAFDVIGQKQASNLEGEKIYPLIKNALDHGKKVQLSVKGLDLDSTFFDEAVCRLYGDFPEATVDNNVEIVDIRKVDTYGLRDVRKKRKLYFYDRPEYDAQVRWLREWASREDPSLLCEDFDPDFIPPAGDAYATRQHGQWIDRETGEEYFI